jgi:hypothetical protein
MPLGRFRRSQRLGPGSADSREAPRDGRIEDAARPAIAGPIRDAAATLIAGSLAS